jgi:ABC-2 type transport system permease protein
MTAILALIRKDLILFRSDRRALLLRLVMPIVLGAFFGYLFGGSGTSDNTKIRVALIVQDTGDVARKIADALKADTALAVEEMPLDQAKQQVAKGRIAAAILLPAGFGDAAATALFHSKNRPDIPVYYDPSQGAALSMVKGMLTRHVMQAVSADVFGGPAGERMIDERLKALEEKAANDPDSASLFRMLTSVRRFRMEHPRAAGEGGMSMPYTTHDEPLGSGPKYNGYAHAFAGMSVQFILFMAVDAGIAILLARRQGLWNRLRAAPLPLNGILLASALSTAIIAFGSLCTIFLAATLLFKVRIAGTMLGFAGVGACFALMTATFGLLIAAWGRTPEAARGLAVFATLLMVMLGGAWVPSFLFPEWLQTATLMIPTRWAVDGLDAVTWRGLGLEAALPAMGVQLGFALLFGALALHKFNRDARHAA